MIIKNYSVTLKMMTSLMQDLTIIFILLLVSACQDQSSQRNIEAAQTNKVTIVNPLHSKKPTFPDGDVQAYIEIPSGSLEKWELNKTTGQLEQDQIDSLPRVINYLGYPGNYGMIPQTLLPKAEGGDGDPLDVLVLGASVEQGTLLKSKLIGVLHLLDTGEQDDKLIAVAENSPLYHLNSLKGISQDYPGVLEIIELWFTNYKGTDIVISKGYGDELAAKHILNSALNAYQVSKKDIKK